MCFITEADIRRLFQVRNDTNAHYSEVLTDIIALNDRSPLDMHLERNCTCVFSMDGVSKTAQ
eukprot:m.1647791 g.1647791  ORF g.1647791 m.1647791 type:complete len:62 (-) comp76359_c0_seq1:562-747(-)